MGSWRWSAGRYRCRRLSKPRRAPAPRQVAPLPSPSRPWRGLSARLHRELLLDLIVGLAEQRLRHTPLRRRPLLRAAGARGDAVPHGRRHQAAASAAAWDTVRSNGGHHIVDGGGHGPKREHGMLANDDCAEIGACQSSDGSGTTKRRSAASKSARGTDSRPKPSSVVLTPAPHLSSAPPIGLGTRCSAPPVQPS